MKANSLNLSAATAARLTAIQKRLGLRSRSAAAAHVVMRAGPVPAMVAPMAVTQATSIYLPLDARIRLEVLTRHLNKHRHPAAEAFGAATAFQWAVWAFPVGDDGEGSAALAA